ncbi:glycosyltransferase family 4 protein [Desulfatitalea alkaliphila]|uniref:Glycosyltransferase family 4 protein n=1 Tax=Desulfatitalea alkaliphila TaxID=2929485 RepID=A0AA41R259_9BACT|nr:glycosyltransferase family 4 protein [Desulfatitalea alkaliphila]MCJ8500737.1 glycosyltransferase family 4 protein [Desulfatitalea alkaliphila]
MTERAGTQKTKQRLTVLQMLPELKEGGVECETVEMAAHLVQRGHNSIVATQGGRMVATLEAEGSTHILYRHLGEKSPRCLGHIPALRRLLLERRVNVLHLRSRVPAWVGYLTWLSLPKPLRPCIVTTFHGFYSVNAFSAIMTKGQKTIAVSETIKDHILENYQIPERRVEVIYSGFDDHLFNPDLVSTERIEAILSGWQLPLPDVPIIFFPGRITRLKGHILFIRSLAMIKDHGWIAVCAGDVNENPNLAAELKEMITTFGLGDRILFPGYCTDMPAALMTAHLVVVPSIKPESFGRTAVEAQAMGKPVIASAHGGSLETVVDRRTGLLVKPNDANEMAKALKLLLSDPKLAVRLGQAGQLRVREKFVARQMFDKTLRLYTDLKAETHPYLLRETRHS